MAPQASKPQPSSRSMPAGEPERTGAVSSMSCPAQNESQTLSLPSDEKSKAEQKPADGGLFSDQSKQADLFDPAIVSWGHRGDQ